MKKTGILIILIIFFTPYAIAIIKSNTTQGKSTPGIPLPEHPRPDFMRQEWLNLNGAWEFEYDRENAGIGQRWFDEKHEFRDKITVPYSWGSELSGIEDKADIGWYKRSINIPISWKGKRIFIVIGASDWLNKAWIDGSFLGEFQGGYTPFEFELTGHIKYGTEQNIVLRVDDTPHPFKLEGKQGYGKARGIWQTVYLEARGNNFIDFIHFSPDIDQSSVKAEGSLAGNAASQTVLRLVINPGQGNEKVIEQKLIPGKKEFSFEIPLSSLHLWSLEDPYLYEVNIELVSGGAGTDKVNTYFGMRKISTMKLPGTEFMYVALNNKPIYLKMTLDQAYHPEGFYTWPSDEFMRDEIIRSKKIGLNCNRIHVKVEVPRKLYWADRLGLLIMADVPNSWGEPDSAMRIESETAMVNMLKRDYNHPAIFSWILFNETWGLFTNTDSGRHYLPQTRSWVQLMYEEAKNLDPTRLVEDNSACNYDHVKTDLNSWHAYLPGYGWKKILDEFTARTYPGSDYNYAKGYLQGNEPMLNSECGNVWGYEGSTGDVDWSWDYHIMMNQFRMHPKVAGWLYTEHHDVINEWNGYYRFDRTEKSTGLGEIVNGMSLSDFHSDIYLIPDYDLCTDFQPGTEADIPVWISVMTDKIPSDKVNVHSWLRGMNRLGQEYQEDLGFKTYYIKPWMTEKTGTWKIKIPDSEGLCILSFQVEDLSGNILHRNFITFNILRNKEDLQFEESTGGNVFKILSFKPNSFSGQQWSQKQWMAMDGRKINGAGTGYFEFKVDIPSGMKFEDILEVTFRAELSAKQLFGKDNDKESQMGGDYMRGEGTFDPARNPNAYPMTDGQKFPSLVTVRINGKVTGNQFLPDDPADHRGILSWHSQQRNGKLSEAGSYGYLVNFSIPEDILKEVFNSKQFTIRLEVNEIPGGLAVYGRNSGRYPLDPSLIFRLK